jgi:hypothetical protein
MGVGVEVVVSQPGDRKPDVSPQFLTAGETLAIDRVRLSRPGSENRRPLSAQVDTHADRVITDRINILRSAPISAPPSASRLSANSPGRSPVGVGELTRVRHIAYTSAALHHQHIAEDELVWPKLRASKPSGIGIAEQSQRQRCSRHP